MSNKFEVIGPYDVNINVNVNDSEPEQQTVELMPFQREGQIINDDGDNDFIDVNEITSSDWSVITQTIVNPPHVTSDYAKDVQLTFIDIQTQSKVDSAGEIAEVKWQVGAGDMPTSFVDITDTLEITDTDFVHSNRAGNLKFPETASMPFVLRMVGRITSPLGRLSNKISCLSSIKVTYVIYKL